MSFKRAVLVLIDIIIVSFALILSLAFRFDAEIPQIYLDNYLNSILPILLISVAIFYFCKLYLSILKFASIEEAVQIFLAITILTIAMYSIGMAFNTMFPKSVYIMFMFVGYTLITASRMFYRIFRTVCGMEFINRFIRPQNKNNGNRVMIVGAGYTGATLIKEMKNNEKHIYEPVIVIDDDKEKQKLRIHGIPVVGGSESIGEMAEKYSIQEIIIAIPSANQKRLNEILQIANKTSCKLKIMPTVYDLIGSEINLSKIRDVKIEDLLCREEVKLNTNEISSYIKDKVILVTGGGGSIGSELCRQIAIHKPSKLLILDNYENNAYEIQNELKEKYKENLNLEVLIASIREINRLEKIFKKHKPHVVFHAAAHKHVPLMEANQLEAIKNNIFGTLNVAKCADKFGVKKFVLISTDKAVNPTNIMGATKRFAEMIIQDMSQRSKTEFVAVRFGNVLGSNGSVIPMFKRQIEQGGPITVTHPEITRYFMTIPEASQLVIQAGAIAKGGEIFVLDMGKPVKIVDLAENLIRLSGLTPYKDINIKFVGLRSGEKLYEELLMAEEGLIKTKYQKIFIGKPLKIDSIKLQRDIDTLYNYIQTEQEEIFEYMEEIVPTYERFKYQVVV